MNPCACGSTKIDVEAMLVERTFTYPDGNPGTEWVGESLGAINCAQCGQTVQLSAGMTIALMHHLIEKRYQGEELLR